MATTSKARTVSIPGDTPAAPAAVVELAADTSMAAAVEAMEQVAQPSPEFAAAVEALTVRPEPDPEAELKAQVQALREQNERLMAQLTQMVEQKAPALIVPATNGNNPVKTDKGWLVPPTFGAPPQIAKV